MEPSLGNARRQAELFRLLTKNVKDYAIFIIDVDGRVQTWSVGAERLIGFTEAEIIGKSCDRFFTAEDLASGLPEQLRRLAVENDGAVQDRWCVRSDGTLFWSSGSIAPLLDDGGTLCGFANIIRDRSEIKLADDALAQQTKDALRRQRLYEAALSSTPDLVYVFDLEHRFTFANEALLAMWGRTWDEAIGKTCLELGYEPWHAAMHDREIEQVVRSRQPIKGEVPFTGSSGRRIYEYIFVPVIGENGQVEAVAGTTRDVTERRSAETLVRQNEERFRSLMEQAPFSVQLFAPDGRTTAVNRAWEELWGLTLEQLRDYNVLEDPQLEAKGVLPFIRRGFAGEATLVPAIQYNPNETLGDITRYADPARWLSAVIYPLKDDDGQVREVVLIHQDITARHRAEEALQQAHRELETRVEQRTAELVRANEFMKALLENVQTGIVACDADGGLNLFNTVTREMHGIPEEAIASEHWGKRYDLYRPDGKTPLTKEEIPLYRALLGERVQDVEMVVAPQGSPPRTVSASGQAFYDAQGVKLGAVVSMHDITARTQAEAALRKAHEELERRVAERTEQLSLANQALHEAARSKDELLSTLRQAVLAQEELADMLREQAGSLAAILSATVDNIYLIDGEGRYRYVSDGGATVLGLRPADMTGKTWHELGLPANVMENFDAHRAWVLQAGAPKRAEITYCTASGQQLHYEYTIAPVRSDEGKVVAVVVVSRDDTERKQAEEALANSEARFRLLSEVMPQLVWSSHPDGLIDYCNQRWLDYTGLDADEFKGDGWSVILHPDDRSATLAAWKRSTETGEEFNVEQRLRSHSGEYRWFLTRALPLRNEAREVVKWFGTCTDIEAQKRANDSLRDADRRKDEFLATLAHELRNPLAPIRNSLQILKMPRIDAATAQQTREMMERQVHHLVRLVDDLLDVSRVMRGKIELRNEPVELATVVARAVETAHALIESQGHQLVIDMADESLLLNADPVRLTQVIGNLLTNAAKYTEAGGYIWLTARRIGDEAVLRVRDSGIGIAPEMLPHVFELFMQVDHAASRSQGGLGIGLTLVKNLVEMHEGAVEAHSLGLGQGCEFVVRLPLAVHDLAKKAWEQIQRESGTPATQSLSGHRLLVIDDNQDAANSLAMLLRMKGHQVQVAYDGATALSLAQAYSPHMVFLDIGMPGMDGYEVAQRMRQIDSLKDLVLVALTGWGQPEDRRRTAEAGFDHHLVKPLEPDVLESLLFKLRDAK